MIDTPLFNQLQTDCVDTTTGEWYDESVAPEACKTSLSLMNSQVGQVLVMHAASPSDRTITHPPTHPPLHRPLSGGRV